ncbi:MAG: hypothetical protein L0271_19520 [Gemmatimonadetes bacterium]|nr:hypothetical protein [Gemmatimonadota bacterium]
MSRRMVPLLFVMLALAAACTGEIGVLAQLESETGGDPTPLASLEVRVVPYDRDVIFDSLQAAASSPEPEAPDSLVQLQAAIATAQTDWSAATERWNAARDSLRAIRNRLDQLNRTSAEYRLLFTDFGDQEQRERGANRAMETAFQTYTGLQNRYNSAAEEFSIQYNAWADGAFAAVDEVVTRRLEAIGSEEVWDTTDANGVVRVTGLKRGDWWVHARYDLPFEELYWNVPVTVGGEPATVQLNRATGENRARYGG